MTTNEKLIEIYKNNPTYKSNVKFGLIAFIILDLLSFLAGILTGWIIWR